MAENGYNGMLNAKQCHHGFPKKQFAKHMSNWPHGSYLVATCKLENEKKICFVACKWNFKKLSVLLSQKMLVPPNPIQNTHALLSAMMNLGM